VFAASTPRGPASGPANEGYAAHKNVGESAGVAARVAAVVWAVGLVVGLIALASGYMMAGVTLLLAVVAPWFGLAAVLRSKPRVLDAELHWQATRSAKPAPVPSSGYRIRLPAR
jgi:hypothetical protein